MPTGVSNVSIVVRGENKVGPAMREAANDVDALTDAIDRAGKKIKPGGGGKGGVPGSNMQAFSQRQVLGPLQQLSFGLEDFFTVFSTSGWVGGTRAAANNISMAASIINPWLGIGLGVGASLVPTLLSAMIEDTDELSTSMERALELTTALKRQSEAAGTRHDMKKSVAEMFGDNTAGAADRLKAGEEFVKERGSDIERLRKQQTPFTLTAEAFDAQMADAINARLRTLDYTGNDLNLWNSIVKDFQDARTLGDRFAAFEQLDKMFDVGGDDYMEGLKSAVGDVVKEYNELQSAIDEATEAQKEATRRREEMENDAGFQNRLEAEYEANHQAATDRFNAYNEEVAKKERDRVREEMSGLSGSKEVTAASREIALIGRAFEADMDAMRKRFLGDDNEMSADERAGFEAAAAALAERSRGDLLDIRNRFGGDPFEQKALGAAIDPRTQAGVSYLNRLVHGNAATQDAGRLQREANSVLRDIERNTREEHGVKVTVEDII